MNSKLVSKCAARPENQKPEVLQSKIFVVAAEQMERQEGFCAGHDLSLIRISDHHNTSATPTLLSAPSGGRHRKPFSR